MADEYSSIDDQIDAQDQSLGAVDPNDASNEGAEGSSVEAALADVNAEVETAEQPGEPAIEQPAPTMEAMAQAMAPMVANAISQALGPLLERLPQPAAAPAAPNPWELPASDALRSPLPTHASDYTQGRIAKAREGLAQWAPIADNPNHERHADAQKMVTHYRDRLRDAHHLAKLEEDSANTRAQLEQLQRQPAVNAIQQRAQGLLQNAETLIKHQYPALGAAVKAGEDLNEYAAYVDWSRPENEAIADFERILRIAERSFARGVKQQPAPAAKPAPTGHNPAKTVPPSGESGTRGTDDDPGFWSVEEHFAEHDRKLAMN